MPPLGKGLAVLSPAIAGSLPQGAKALAGHIMETIPLAGFCSCTHIDPCYFLINLIQGIYPDGLRYGR